MGALLAFFLIVIGTLLYFLPTFIAMNRYHLNKMPILICNLFFGWTFIGWVVCLIWSTTSNTANA